jgi:hypothetical protein
VGEAEHGGRTAEEPAALPDLVLRRLDEIFGDVLPDVTRDEQREVADEPPPAAGDEWLRANRPPHHGG